MKLAAPLLLLLLLMGGAAGVCGRQGKATSLDQFMEEVRGALASHWELLQNLRYHTLGIKVRLVQLEAQIQNLSEHLHAGKGGQDTEPHDIGERGSCRNGDGTIGDVAEEVAEGGGGGEVDDEMQDLLEAMRNLTEVYSTLAAANRLCGGIKPENDGRASLGPHTTTLTTTPPTDEEVTQESGTEDSLHTNVTAEIGSTAVLNCRLDRIQDPEQVSWIRVRDQNWLSQGRHKVAANEARISVDFSDEALHYYRLFLEDVRREDEGAYDCHLSTTPSLRRTIWLTVADAPPSPPHLTQLPQDTLTVEGQDVTLICMASGSPQPSVTWTRNKLQVSPSARHRISPAGDLTIRDVRRGDAGRYECRGVNSEGEARGAALLTVRQPTRIVRPPRDRERLVGDKVVMRCRVEWDEGTPLLLEWLKDGEVIDFSDATFGNRFSLLPNNALVVSFVHLQDAGVYTCRASTPFDSTSAAATLTVRRTVPAGTSATTTTTTTITAAAAATTTTAVLRLDYCPPPFDRIQKHVCVKEVTHMKLSWDEAAEHCRSHGGQLAWEAEGKRVIQDFLDVRFGLGRSKTSASTQWPFWVGGREGDDGEWRWLDGALVSVDVWAPHHRRPSGRRAAKGDWCLMLDGYQGYNGTALPCHSKRYFLCRLK